MFNKSNFILIVGLLLCALLPQTTVAQWVKQTLASTVGTPHMAYPGLNKNAIGKNYLMMFSGNADGANPFDGSIQAVRTTDGGKTYRTSTVPLAMADHHQSPFILDAKTSFLATTNRTTGATAIHRTVDSGATWQVLPYHPVGFLNSVIFFDQNNGVAILDQDSIGTFIAYTTNGGTSFTRLSPTNVPRAGLHEVIAGGIQQVLGDAIFQPTFDTETGAWRMWRSTDRGRNWSAGEWQEENSGAGSVVWVITRLAVGSVKIGESGGAASDDISVFLYHEEVSFWGYLI